MAAAAGFEVCFDSGIPAAYLVKWKVKPGSRISQGSILLLYDEKKPCDDNGSVGNLKKMKATMVGTVLKLLKTEGDAIHQGCAILIMQGCSHPIVMKDMCAECGADLREYGTRQEQKSQKASVAMVHSIPELVVSQEQAHFLGKADEVRLLKHKKLVLLVDLDQTLIHTTNDDIPANLKDVHHFQLYGSHSPWYHARLRPGTTEFLEKISKLFELHICTFGARTYAHTIARFLDKDGRYFSHRILSRDECFNPSSKTANLSALFPCGDHLVCIIDDREDVWNYAPNLIHVKPYHFFQHTGDINAPPGLSKSENDLENEGKFFIGRKVTRIKKPGKSTEKTVDLAKATSGSNSVESNEPECAELSVPVDLTTQAKSGTELPNSEISQDLTVETENGIKSSADETSGNEETDPLQNITSNDPLQNVTAIDPLQNVTAIDPLQNSTAVDPLQVTTVIDPLQNTTAIDPQQNSTAVDPLRNTTAIDLLQNTTAVDPLQNTTAVDPLQNTTTIDPLQNITATDPPQDAAVAKMEISENATIDDAESDTTVNVHSSLTENGETGESEKPTNETKTAPNDSEQEENLLDVEDDDDYLLYLSEILENIHRSFYQDYVETPSEIPDLKKVIPRVRQKVLRGVRLVFSGVIPTNIPAGKSRAYHVARSFGAEIQQNIVLRSKDNKHKTTTHVVAARLGTIKVNEAKRSRRIHVVTPDWLWCCASRWERVSEGLFPLTKDTAVDQKQALLETIRTSENVSAFEMVPRQTQPKMEIFPTYDPVTGKRIHKVQPTVKEPVKPAEKPQNVNSGAAESSEPAPKFSDSFNPLMRLSSEEIASMDQEVEDLLDSPDTDEEDSIEETTKKLVLKQTTERNESSSSSSSNEAPHGWRKASRKRKSNCTDEEEVADDTETENDGEYERPKYPRCELPNDSAKSDSEGDSDEFNNSVGSVDEEMAAAVEREFLGM